MTTRREFNKDAAGAAAGIAFTGCSVVGAAPAQAQAQTTPAGRRREVVVNGRRVKTIDVHAHCVITETLLMMGRKVENQRGPGLAIVAQDRIREMDEQGIDVEALRTRQTISDWIREARS